MDNNQQEQDSVLLEKRKRDIPNLSSHPSYQAHGDDALVDFSVDDIQDSLNFELALQDQKEKPIVVKVPFECDEVITIRLEKPLKKKEKKRKQKALAREFEFYEIPRVTNRTDFEEQLKARGKVALDKPVVIAKPKPKEPVVDTKITIPLCLFKGKLSNCEDAIYDSAFSTDAAISLIEKREKAEYISPKKEVAPEPEVIPDNPELVEVKDYLSQYPIHKVHRGIITEADSDYLPDEAFKDGAVLDDILGRSKEAAIEKAKEEVASEVAKDVEDQELFNYAKAPLASEEEISELEKKHMELYSSISRIQEIQSANDFKSAYQIQDRISYLLNHRTLLYKSLTKELIKFIDSIIKKLDSYYEQASVKYAELKVYNEKISGVKNYKWKADESMKIIQETKESAEREFENL